MLLPLCRLALDDIHSNHDPLLTLTRSRMTTLQEDQEEEEGKDKCLVSSLVRVSSFVLRNSIHLTLICFNSRKGQIWRADDRDDKWSFGTT